MKFCAQLRKGSFARPLASKLAPRLSRCQAQAATAPWSALDDALKFVAASPSIQKMDASKEVMDVMKTLKESGAITKWGSAADGTFSRRTISLTDLKMVGVKAPDQIAAPSTRNDLAFLVTVVGVSSVLAVAASFLPGDWGFFMSYFSGGISILVLAIGSTNPGVLAFFIDKFSQVFPDYRDRVLRHEAAHFLIGYLLGVPVLGYDLAIGREHTDFAEAKLQKRLFQSNLSTQDIDQLAVVAMAGVAAEAMEFDDVMGQTADLLDLQRILNRSMDKLSNSQQQNATRWAVWQACCLLRSNKKEYGALQEAMGGFKTVSECVKAIENA